jgi:hypothetical protein
MAKRKFLAKRQLVGSIAAALGEEIFLDPDDKDVAALESKGYIETVIRTQVSEPDVVFTEKKAPKKSSKRAAKDNILKDRVSKPLDLDLFE